MKIIIILSLLFSGCAREYYKYEIWQSGVLIDTRCREVVENNDPYSIQGYTDGNVYYKNTWIKCGNYKK